MRLRALVCIAGRDLTLEPGQEFDREPEEAARLIARGYAEAVGGDLVERAVHAPPAENRDPGGRWPRGATASTKPKGRRK